MGKAYVDDQNPEEVSANRGTLTEPGKNSPYRDRDIEENMDLLERMKNGEFPDGARVLRAKIDMAHPNINMRDPVMYRIIHEPAHHRTGSKWKIYPMYDWSHGQNDSMEGITHSLCSLEYENHRPLYEWFLDQLGEFKPRQIEFSRLNLTYTVMSKRKLLRLVKEGHVKGWDDPRMPTLRGMRRRGYTAEAIIDLSTLHVWPTNYSVMAMSALLEACVRDDLNKTAPRRMAVIRPLKVVIDNYPDDTSRKWTRSTIPKTHLQEHAKYRFPKFFTSKRMIFARLLRPNIIACIPATKCDCVMLTSSSVRMWSRMREGEVVEIHCTYDPSTRGGDSPDGRKVKSTIHWVSAEHAKPVEVRMYDRLFTKEDPEEGEDDFLQCLNPNSLRSLTGYVEPSLTPTQAGDRFQFEQLGYFCVDPNSTEEKPVFNLTVTLKDTWAKIEKSK